MVIEESLSKTNCSKRVNEPTYRYYLITIIYFSIIEQ